MRSSRPIGLTLLTAYDALMVGLVPMALTIQTFYAAPPDGPAILTDLFVPLVLGAGILYVAAGTYRGENAARFWLLALTTIHYVGIWLGAPFTVDLVAYVQTDASGDLEAWLRAVRSLFWIGLHGWYLLFSRAAGFFESESAAR